MLSPWSCQCSWDFSSCDLILVYVRHFQPLWRFWSIIYLQSLWISWSFVYLHHGDSDLFILYVVMTTYVILYHAYSWPLYSYVSRTTTSTSSYVQIFYHCIVLIGWMVLPLGSSSLHFWDGLIMYFSHRMTPLTSHIRGHLLQLILPHMVDHTFMAFPVSLQTL